MDKEYKSKIYERLLEIRLNIDISMTPTPQQINEKIGECHSYIEEVEHFNIRVHKELSIIQKALNNAQAQFELKKDTLITQEPIRSLPNIKDREAQSNLLLREDRDHVKEYQNELTDLNNLLKVITLKQRNLTRANADIKLQMRVLDAQLKLGSGSATSAAAKGLMEEMHKSNMEKDSFEEALSEAKEEEVVDPTESIDMTELFMDPEPEKDKLPEPEKENLTDLFMDPEDDLSEKLIEPVPNLNPDEGEEIPPVEDWNIDNENIISIGKKDTENTEPEIDLEEAINLDNKGGDKTTEKEITQKEEVKQKEEIEQKEDHSEIGGIDIDDLLEEYT